MFYSLIETLVLTTGVCEAENMSGKQLWSASRARSVVPNLKLEDVEGVDRVYDAGMRIEKCEIAVGR